MSTAHVSFELHQFGAVLADGAQAEDVCDQRAPSATAQRSPPPVRLPVSRQQLGILILQNMPGLERFASRLAPQRADAQDLIQETCRKALVAHAMLIRGTNVTAWLRCILRNVHRDWIRRGRHEIPVADLCETWASAVPEDRPAWSCVSDEELARALARLPPPYRSVYALRANEGRSNKEIARALRIKEQTVATRLYRARGILRTLLLSESPVTRQRV
jgi:RNA polymerase sigma-70 factor (ECF subfamily)